VGPCSRQQGRVYNFTWLLYHNDRHVCQLCVPQVRRDDLLKLAHDSVFGGHMGERKTFERVRLSFTGQGCAIV